MIREPAIYSRKAFFSAGHADTMVNRIELHGQTDPHGHDFIEIALAAAGSGRHISASGEHELSPGDVVVIRPGTWHGFTHCCGLVIYNCCFDQQLLRRELGWLREDPALNYLFWVGPYAANRAGVLVAGLYENHLDECLDQLHALRQVQGSPRRVETLGRLLIFLDYLARAVNDRNGLDRQAGPLHPAVLETLRLLESQTGSSWSLGELAAHSHVNPSYLARLFKAEIGLAPMAYLNRCRVEQAAGLLLQSELPVGEVAIEVGWDDPNLFTRRFRAAYGLAPSEYRKRFSGDRRSHSQPYFP